MHKSMVFSTFILHILTYHHVECININKMIYFVGDIMSIGHENGFQRLSFKSFMHLRPHSPGSYPPTSPALQR